MANRDNYVRTGNSTITRLTNKLSLIPFAGPILASGLGTASVLWDSAKWLMRGKVGSAATELATGMVGHGVNVAMGSMGVFWWLTGAATPLVSSHTMGTHGRKLAEEAIGAVTGALGMKPQVLRSYPAGIGSMPGAANYFAPQGPGQWATRAAQERGLDPQARYQQYANGDGREHVEALRNAQAMGGAQYR
jgi:hypothetical protein